MIHYKSPAEIECMAAAGSIVGSAFLAVEAMLGVGVSTREIDDSVRGFLADRAAAPLFFNYRGFPASCCVSVNDEVVHGIPGARRLLDGDIVTVDIGARYRGFCVDAARTFLIGAPSPTRRAVVDCCRQALVAGIAAATPGAYLSEIGRAIENCVTAAGFAVVRQYVGHGIGREMHEEPPVLNFVPPNYREHDLILAPGLVIAIEPMVCARSAELRTAADGWTVLTVDGGAAAHWEDTVAIQEAGARILTTAPDGGAHAAAAEQHP